MSSRDRSPCLQDRVGFLPEIPGQRGRVPALMGPDRPRPVPMAALPASPRTGAPPLPHRVRIAETDPPGTVRSMLCERAAQPVRSFLSHLGSQRTGPHPLPRPAGERPLALKVGRRVVCGARDWRHGRTTLIDESNDLQVRYMKAVRMARAGDAGKAVG